MYLLIINLCLVFIIQDRVWQHHCSYGGTIVLMSFRGALNCPSLCRETLFFRTADVFFNCDVRGVSGRCFIWALMVAERREPLGQPDRCSFSSQFTRIDFHFSPNWSMFNWSKLVHVIIPCLLSTKQNSVWLFYLIPFHVYYQPNKIPFGS